MSSTPTQPDRILEKLNDTSTIKLDRWRITLKLRDGGSEQVMMNNYFSIG